MFGGLARHETITYEAMMTVVCHEVGHHLGGAPKYYGNNWASNEGQADYYGSLKCMRKVFTAEENLEWAKTAEIDPVALDQCEANFKTDADVAICARSAMAGRSLSRLFRALRKEEREPKFDEPDANKVSRTSDRHPGTQCRMDTYFQGALCGVSSDVDVDTDDANIGTCNRAEGYTHGLRSLCWFKPKTN